VCIDVFSRYTWVTPMKNKTKETVCESMKKILKDIQPAIINCDQGSEFNSHVFFKN